MTDTNFVDEMHSSWDTLDEMLVTTAKEGFYQLTSPPYQMPVLTPEALTNFNSSQYAMLQAQMEGWKSYTDSRLAVIESGIFQCDNEMDDIMTMMRKQIREAAEAADEKKPSEIDIKEMIKSSPRYRQLKLEHQKLKQAKNLLQTHLERLGRGLALLSRNIEAKKLEQGNQGRRGM